MTTTTGNTNVATLVSSWNALCESRTFTYAAESNACVREAASAARADIAALSDEDKEALSDGAIAHKDAQRGYLTQTSERTLQRVIAAGYPLEAILAFALWR